MRATEPIIILDPGHGRLTPGKCSPDHRLEEWLWTRQTCALIREMLSDAHLDCRLTVADDSDISLAQRVNSVNRICALTSVPPLLLSIHVNASACGSWGNAHGWSAWVATNASRQSRDLAKTLTRQAESLNLLGNRATPPNQYWTADFYILRHTRCPAVLTENLFMDHPGDLEFLLQPSTRQLIARLHADAISHFLKY